MTRLETSPSERQAGEQLRELRPLVGEHLRPRRDVLQRRGEHLPLGRESRGQPVEAVQRPDDVGLLRVEAADEGVELVEQVLDLGLAAPAGPGSARG